MKAKKTKHVWFHKISLGTTERLVYDIGELYLELTGRKISLLTKRNMGHYMNSDFYKCK